MITAVSAFAITSVLAGISFMPRGANGEFSLEALQAAIAGQQSELDNHEARISNTEKDVADVQANTNTSPAQDRVSVPQSTNTTTSTNTAPGQSNTPPAQVQNSPEPQPAPTLTKTMHYYCFPTTNNPDSTVQKLIQEEYSDGSLRNYTEARQPWPYGVCSITQGSW